MKIKKLVLSCLLVPCLLSLLSLNLFAMNVFYHQTTNEFGGIGSPINKLIKEDIQTAMNSWDTNVASDLFTFNPYISRVKTGYNTKYEVDTNCTVYITNFATNSLLPEVIKAQKDKVAYTMYGDIYINTNFAWKIIRGTTQSWSFGAPQPVGVEYQSFLGTLTHEFGHTFGLGHDKTQGTAMYAGDAYGWLGVTLKANDIKRGKVLAAFIKSPDIYEAYGYNPFDGPARGGAGQR